MLKNARLLTRPTPARQDAPFRGQCRRERRGEEVQTALRVGRVSLQWILANGKVPPVLPTSEKFLLNVEPLSDARTPLVDFFSILLSLSTSNPVDNQQNAERQNHEDNRILHKLIFASWGCLYGCRSVGAGKL